jgi:hypothetical protein
MPKSTIDKEETDTKCTITCVSETITDVELIMYSDPDNVLPKEETTEQSEPPPSTLAQETRQTQMTEKAGSLWRSIPPISLVVPNLDPLGSLCVLAMI